LQAIALRPRAKGGRLKSRFRKVKEGAMVLEAGAFVTV